MRTLEQLIDRDDPGWPIVLEWIAGATNGVEVLPANKSDRDQALVDLQVTTRSPMGALVYESGGLLVDGGWLRILGSGHERLPRSISKWNRATVWTDPSKPPPMLLVADDVVGGFFAINGGALAGKPGNVHYLSPESLDWMDLDIGYTQFVGWALQGDIASFYADLRWPRWRQDVQEVAGDEAYSIYPFLWAEGPPIGERKRKPVPVAEVFSLQVEFRRQMSGD